MAEMQGPNATHRRCKLMLMMALLVFVEFVLATALYETSWFVLQKEMLSPPGENGPSGSCYYQLPPSLFGMQWVPWEKVAYGKPRVEWAVAALSYLVVLLTVKDDDRQVLGMASPEALTFPVNKMLFILWMFRSFYRSAWITMATIVLIAGSNDSGGMILNSVAATFLSEIDDLVYSAVLSPETRERYQQNQFKGMEPFCDPTKIEYFAWCF